MNISLTSIPSTDIKPVPQKVYDEELDDVRSILMDLCEELSSQEAVEFAVAGFGDADWPVDVEVDLAVLMEQVPTAISSLGRRDDFVVHFYEQGLQRHLSFRCTGSSYRITCVSSTAWQPSPAEEDMSCGDIENMLLSVKHEFLRSADVISPGVSKHPWMAAWSEGAAA